MDINCQRYDRTLKISKRADQQGPAGLEVQWQSPWVSCVLHLRSGLEGAGKYKQANKQTKNKAYTKKKKSPKQSSLSLSKRPESGRPNLVLWRIEDKNTEQNTLLEANTI